MANNFLANIVKGHVVAGQLRSNISTILDLGIINNENANDLIIHQMIAVIGKKSFEYLFVLPLCLRSECIYRLNIFEKILDESFFAHSFKITTAGFKDSITQLPVIEIYSRMPTPVTESCQSLFSTSSYIQESNTYMESLQMIILISASFMVILALLGRYISLEGVKAPGVCGDVVDQAALDDIFFNDNKFAN